MSAQFQLVSAIIARAVRQADVQGQDDRHTAAELLAQFNASASELRVRLTQDGFGWFLERLSGTLPIVAAASGETYAEIDWPKDAMRIYRIDVLFQTGLWLPLKPVSVSGLRDYQRFRNVWSLGGISGGPCAWSFRKAPFGAAAVETVGKIMVAPVPRTARPYAMFYLSNWADLTTSDTFNGHASFIEWIVQDMVCKLAESDNDSNETYQIAATERLRLEALIANEAPRTQMQESEEPRRADIDYDDNWGPRELL